MKKKEKIRTLLFFLLSYIIFIPLINKYLKIVESVFKVHLNTINSNFLNLFVVMYRNKIVFIVWLVLNLIIILINKCILKTKQNSKIEVEGVNLKKKDGTFGTADWGTIEEIEEYLSIGKRDGIILGETEEQKIITLPLNTYLNKNIAVFGASGSGKSIGFALPNGIELAQQGLQNAVQRSMSIVFTDPKRRII